MSEKVYTIKPLMWRESVATLGAWYASAEDGTSYSVWPSEFVVGPDSGKFRCNIKRCPLFATVQAAMEACQIEYESRLGKFLEEARKS